MVKVLKEGEFFGEISFFTHSISSFSVRSEDFCSLYRISSEKFKSILMEHSEDYEKFCEIRDNLIYNRRFDLVDYYCGVCEESNHLSKNCPAIQYKPDYFKLFIENTVNRWFNFFGYFLIKRTTWFKSKERSVKEENFPSVKLYCNNQKSKNVK